MKSTLCAVLLLPIFFIDSYAQDWGKGATLPGPVECMTTPKREVCFSSHNRENILELPMSLFEKYVQEGAKHASLYPIKVTGLLIPYRPLESVFEENERSDIRSFIMRMAGKISGVKSMERVYEWLGLHKIPDYQSSSTPNKLPLEVKTDDITHFGVSVLDMDGTKALTMSCATCHSSNLFGVPVMGLTNRFPRANEFFLYGKKALQASDPVLFRELFKTTKEEQAIFVSSKKSVKFIETKKPIALGLDTSLSHVGLSLSRRAKDEYATRNNFNANFPRANKLRSNPADSKPAVWWNLKYKTRWLSDGSVLSGNPVVTNVLWNEIGRGTDLKKLETWINENKKTVDELTAYVFSAKAPEYNKFFPGKIDLGLAKLGQKKFLNNCSSCHGVYKKGWEMDESLGLEEQIKTVKVMYHKETPVVDIGTDPYRYQGMNYFADDLNRLKISKEMGVEVVPQKGYVPPPLVGVWARFPYFHNNSVPTLYDVLTPDTKRPVTFRMTDTIYPETDFDFVKNGYPAREKMREPFKSRKKFLFDTRVRGLSNSGHTKGILLDEFGQEKFSHDDKLEIIEFLKTL